MSIERSKEMDAVMGKLGIKPKKQRKDEEKQQDMFPRSPCCNFIMARTYYDISYCVRCQHIVDRSSGVDKPTGWHVRNEVDYIKIKDPSFDEAEHAKKKYDTITNKKGEKTEATVPLKAPVKMTQQEVFSTLPAKDKVVNLDDVEVPF